MVCSSTSVQEALGQSPALPKQDAVTHSCNRSPCEVQARDRKFKDILGCLASSVLKRRTDTERERKGEEGRYSPYRS